MKQKLFWEQCFLGTALYLFQRSNLRKFLKSTQIMNLSTKNMYTDYSNEILVYLFVLYKTIPLRTVSLIRLI